MFNETTRSVLESCLRCVNPSDSRRLQTFVFLSVNVKSSIIYRKNITVKEIVRIVI